MRPAGLDKIIWSAQTKIFSVASCYQHLRASTSHSSFPHQVIWNSIAPPKAQLLAWRTYWNGMPTVDVLNRRGLFIPNRCSLCKADVESVDHLFFRCPVSSALWYEIWRWRGIRLSLPTSLKLLISSWPINGTKGPLDMLWQGAVLAGIQVIWSTRNDLIFNNGSTSYDLFIQTIKILFEWFHIRGGHKPSSIPYSPQFWM